MTIAVSVVIDVSTAKSMRNFESNVVVSIMEDPPCNPYLRCNPPS